jgi:hypothetical protein
MKKKVHFHPDGVTAWAGAMHFAGFIPHPRGIDGLMPGICLAVDRDFHEHLPVCPCCPINSAARRWGWPTGVTVPMAEENATFDGGRAGWPRQARPRPTLTVPAPTLQRRFHQKFQNPQHPIRKPLPKDKSLVLLEALHALQHPFGCVVPFNQQNRRFAP